VEAAVPEKKIVVGAIGVGVVGTVLSACLARAGAAVHVVDLPERLAQVAAHGLQVRGLGLEMDERATPVESVHALRGIEADYLLVATKAYVLKSILPAVAEVAGENCLIISAENGIGTEDEIASHVPRRNAARMVVNYAGHIEPSGIAQLIWFNPPNYFGPLEATPDPRLKRLTDMLCSSKLTSEMVDAEMIKARAFLKTILTSALMPLCAVMGLTMQEAMDGKPTRQIAGDLLREGLAVAQRLGYDYGEGIWEKCMGYLAKGGDHHPSMSWDLWSKRPTEIDYINGKILELGQGFGDVDVEVNRVMTSLLMMLEVRNGTRRVDECPDCLQARKWGRPAERSV
jgi:2-dehydropantoate 2-reductase